MSACSEFENRLLDDADSAAAQHVRQCAACADETRSLQDVLGAAHGPPLTAADRAAAALLPNSTAAVWRMAQRRRAFWRPAWTFGLVGAAALSLFVVPRIFPHSPAVIPSVTEDNMPDDGSVVEMTGIAFEDDDFWAEGTDTDLNSEGAEQ